MLRCGVKPQVSRISKIIYDQFTGNVYAKGSTLSILGIFNDESSRLSGFRRGWPIRDQLEWLDTHYVAHGLAKQPDERDWRSYPEKWEL